MIPRRPGGHCAVLIYLLACLTRVFCFDYKYLGCYQDSDILADVNGQQITLDPETFDFYQCVTECQRMGYPYVGIQNKQKCFCGHTYGRYGTSNACNYTCDISIPCGGYKANDIFYSLKTDSTTESLREDDVYTEEMTFEDARSVCVRYDGDILPVITSTDWTDMKSLLNEAGIVTGYVWLGLRKIFDGATSYSYTDRSKPTFSSSSYSNWMEDETQANPCVKINVEDGTWESTSCTGQYAFICHQEPAPDALPTDSDGSGDSEDDTSSGFDKSKLSLYIVLPLFGVCYGGSCLMYCIHKIYKALKRKKRQKMLLSKMEESADTGHVIEYEPHTKPGHVAGLSKQNEGNMAGSRLPPPMVGPPMAAAQNKQPPPPRYTPHPKPQSLRPFSASKRASVHPIMAPPPPLFTDRPGTKTPLSPRGEPEGEQAKEEPEIQKPQSARDVEIDLLSSASVEPQPSPMTSTPPPVVTADAVSTAATAVEAMKPDERRPGTRSQSAKTKSELRKQRLLNKALKEARERRRREAASEEPEAPSAPPSESPDDSQWAQRPRKRNKSPLYGSDPDSADSTVNLLSESERGQSLDPNEMEPRDPTKMSIQEILRMKVAMNRGRKRPKKPISA